MSETFTISVEKIPVKESDIKAALTKLTGGKKFGWIKGRGPMYDAYFDDIAGTFGCHASIKIPYVDSKEAIHINMFYKFPDKSGPGKLIGERGRGKGYNAKTGKGYDSPTIERTKNWEEKFINQVSTELESCRGLAEWIKKEQAKKGKSLPEIKTSTLKIVADQVVEGASYMRGSIEMCNQYTSSDAKKANPCKTIIGHVGDDTKPHYISFTPANVSNYKSIAKGKTYKIPKLLCNDHTSKAGKKYVGCKIVSSVPIQFDLM